MRKFNRLQPLPNRCALRLFSRAVLFVPLFGIPVWAAPAKGAAPTAAVAPAPTGTSSSAQPPARPPRPVAPTPASKKPAEPVTVGKVLPGIAGQLAENMALEVDRRLAGKSPEESRHLFSNTSAAWAEDVFVPNKKLWCDDLRPQLTGISMLAGPWRQSYCLTPITRRHAVSCGHNGPGMEGGGHLVRYVNTDGKVFETHIAKWINDYPAADVAGRCSGAQKPFVTDLSLYLLADELPEWVCIAPIITLTKEQRAAMEAANPPFVAVSQGNWPAGPPVSNTSHNRKVYVKNQKFGTETGQRLAFLHRPQIGDSGTPDFVLANGRLYFNRVITSGNGDGVFVGDYIPLLNSFIARADALQGITTGCRVSASSFPLK